MTTPTLRSFTAYRQLVSCVLVEDEICHLFVGAMTDRCGQTRPKWLKRYGSVG